MIVERLLADQSSGDAAEELGIGHATLLAYLFGNSAEVARVRAEVEAAAMSAVLE